VTGVSPAPARLQAGVRNPRIRASRRAPLQRAGAPMQRRSFIHHAGLAGVLAAGTAPAIVHAQATLRWRLASSFPKSLDTIYGAAEVFAKKIGEMSSGKFQISIHAGGELMPAFGVVDGVQKGTVEIAHTAPYYFVGKDETFAIGSTIPFGLNSRQMS